jgi:hypothetical protein
MGISQGFTPSLLLAALATFLVGFCICRLYLSLGAALFVSLLKSSVGLFFFAYFNYGQWYMRDDLMYMELSLEMKARGHTPWNTLIGSTHLEPLSAIAGSEHTLYYWWNLLAFWLFGEHYHAAVFLNIMLTFVAGYLMARLLLECGFLRRYTDAFFIFFVLHWDVLSWSSFVNLKDVLVLTLTLSCYFFLFRFIRQISLQSLLGLGTSGYLLLTLRHYVPPFIVAASGIWAFCYWQDRRKYLVGVLIACVVLLLRPWETKYMDYFQISNPLFSAVRFLLMPQFWTVMQPNEGFLEIPALIHWLLFVPMFYGAFLLWREFPLLRIMFIYFAIMTCFYTVVPQLQGMRQRFQLVFVLAICQFHVLWLLLKAGAYARLSAGQQIVSSETAEAVLQDVSAPQVQDRRAQPCIDSSAVARLE